MVEPHRTVADPNTTRDTALAGAAAEVAAPAGRYKILVEIGRGGMGVVYRATDTVLGREVAVKVLQDRLGPGSLAARRFVGEARIASQLQHPGIPAVHDLCLLPDGRPLLAMRLIKGRTFDDFLRDRSPGSPNLVAVFEQVCQAVGYAHAHDVIHRDLKPANVMVGAFGEVQVMDWGIAKVLDRSVNRREPTADAEATVAATAIESDRDEGDATRAGSVLGTPAFMPPEQAIGAVDQVDARSDVFGLGAILCTILTGNPPYVGADSEATRQLAARARLDDAFTRLDSCGAEPGLVVLCKRCLSAEKDDRPRNAGEVAAAVAGLRAAAEERARQAELDRVRAEGERARAQVQAGEQRKRRKVLALAAAAVIAALAAAAGLSIWQARVAIAEADNARKAEVAATAAREAEEQQRQTADEALNFMKVVLAYGTSAGQGGKEPKKAPTVREALDWATQRISGQFGDKPLPPLVEAKVRKTVGEAYYRLQDLEEAAVQYQRALEIYRAQLGPDDEATWQTMNDLGEVCKRLKRYDEAEDLLKTALAAKRAKLGNDNRSTQRTVNNLGGLYRDMKRFEEAEPLVREAYETRRRLFGPDDSDTLNSTNNLGALYIRLGKPAEAEPCFREAAEGYERVHGIRFETALYWSNVADSLFVQKRFADAEPVYLKALGLLDRITPEEGKGLRTHIPGQLAKLYTELGKPEEAAKWAAMGGKPVAPPGQEKKP